MSSRLISHALAIAVFIVAASAAAQPASGDTALAEALFRDARSLMEKKQYGQACPKLEESYRLVAKLGTLLNLAACHDEQGKTGSAWGEYTKAVTEAKAAGEKQRVEFAREKLTALEERLTKIVVEVPSPVPGIDVVVGGQTIRKAAWGTPIPLDPGEHELIARAPGHKTMKRKVVLPEGPSTITETLPALEPLPEGEEEETLPPGDEQPDDASSGTSGQAIAGWVVGAVGLVGLGLGAGFGVNTLMKNGDSDDYCNDANQCTQEGVDLRDTALTSAHVSTAAFAVGGAALVAGIILIVTAPSDEPAESARYWLAPHPTYGGGMLSGGVAW